MGSIKTFQEYHRIVRLLLQSAFAAGKCVCRWWIFLPLGGEVGAGHARTVNRCKGAGQNKEFIASKEKCWSKRSSNSVAPAQ